MFLFRRQHNIIDDIRNELKPCFFQQKTLQIAMVAKVHAKVKKMLKYSL
jgi:hypothetical protein